MSDKNDDILEEQRNLQRSIAEPQVNFLKSTLPARSETSNALASTILERLNNPGLPTKFEGDLLRTGRNRIADTVRGLATRSTEALASRGRGDSGINNRILQDLNTEEVQANQALTSGLAERNLSDLMETLRLALGFSTAGPNQIAIPGVPVSGASSSGTGANLGSLAARIASGLLNRKKNTDEQ